MKISSKAVIITLLLSSLLGCTSIFYNSKDDPRTSKGFIAKSQTLVTQQRWEEAELLLERGQNIYPDDVGINNAFQNVKNEWINIKQRLEDWIVVYEAESMLRQRPLIVSMSQSEPSDYFLKRRLLQLDSKLNSKRKILVKCTEYQLAKALKLARRCIESAERIRNSIQVKKLVEEIELRQSALNKKKQVITEKEVAIDLAEKRVTQLMLAQTYLQQQDYHLAFDILEPMLLLYKDDEQVIILMDEASTGRDLQVLQIISHGDRLYREQFIKEAIVVWQQAAKLYPKHGGVTDRLNRANKIFDKLKKIRSEVPVK